MDNLRCPICGKELRLKYNHLACECGWIDPTSYKPMANACKCACAAKGY
jgi:hypothetical protein